jgi:membrane protease YdiL (CAAX protease family)
VLWTLWHLPLLMDNRNVMSQYPLGAWSVATVAAAVLYTWLFNNARGSVLIIVVVFHAMSNTVGGLAPDRAADVVSDAIVQAVLAAIIVVVFGVTQLSRRRERVIAEVTSPAGEPSSGRPGKE